MQVRRVALCRLRRLPPPPEPAPDALSVPPSPRTVAAGPGVGAPRRGVILCASCQHEGLPGLGHGAMAGNASNESMDTIKSMDAHLRDTLEKVLLDVEHLRECWKDLVGLVQQLCHLIVLGSNIIY